ncbi:MAG: NADH-quinone oxidoreductase subunit J [Ilumatobacteraceae bacterium]
MQLLVFVCATLMILAGAVGVITRSHPVHAALSLVLTLFGVAVMYVSQEAHFLAAVQVIVYSGAIVVLFLFVIMLLGVDKAENLQIEPFKLQRKTAGVVGGGIIGLIVFAAISSRDNIGTIKPTQSDAVQAVATGALDPHDNNVRAIARDLFSDHVLAFELTSVLLVIAVVATVLLARRAPKSTAEVPT